MLRQIHRRQKGYSKVMNTATDAVIIGNPNSGRAGDEDYLERLAEILRSGDLRVEVLNTEHPNHATELASLAGDRLVVAAGGDGTVNEALNGLSLRPRWAYCRSERRTCWRGSSVCRSTRPKPAGAHWKANAAGWTRRRHRQ